MQDAPATQALSSHDSSSLESYTDDFYGFQQEHNPRDNMNPMHDLSSSSSSVDGDSQIDDDSDDSGERDDADAFYCTAVLYARIESGKLTGCPF